MSATLQRLPIQGRSPQQQLLVETTGHRPPLRARARARSSTNKNKKNKAACCHVTMPAIRGATSESALDADRFSAPDVQLLAH